MVLPANQEVVATSVSFIFFVLYLTTLFHCLRWLVFADEGWKIRKKINWTMLTVTLAICVLGTLSRALELSNTMILQRAVTVIVRRIYLVARALESSGATLHLRFVMRILFESGALYLATAIAHFVVWFTPSAFAISMISDMNLAFNLILIRAAQRRVEEASGVYDAAVSGIRFNASATKTAASLLADASAVRTIEICRRDEGVAGEWLSSLNVSSALA